MKKQSLQLISSCGLLLVSLAYAAATTPNAGYEIAPIANQSMNLAATLEIPVTMTLPSGDSKDGALKFSVSSDDLASQIQLGDIQISVNPPSQTSASGTENFSIEVVTKTTAVEFQNKKLNLTVTSASGSVLASSSINLSLAPTYIVKVIDGSDANDPNSYNFDSPDATAYFRPQPDGVQMIFEDDCDKNPLIIHGDGAIEHQPLVPITRGQSYRPALILPTQGDNLAGSYTIHGIYKPNRNVIFNAKTIPAGN